MDLEVNVYMEQSKVRSRVGVCQLTWMRGAESHFDVGADSGARRGAEEGKSGGEYLEKHRSGAEAQSILLALSARLKSCPDSLLRLHRLFSQPVKPPQRRGPVAGDPGESCPDTKQLVRGFAGIPKPSLVEEGRSNRRSFGSPPPSSTPGLKSTPGAPFPTPATRTCRRGPRQVVP
jgi:hypothetical protein